MGVVHGQIVEQLAQLFSMPGTIETIVERVVNNWDNCATCREQLGQLFYRMEKSA
jgi:hypothetical protein